MPIYEYLCPDCGLKRDHLQKISEDLLTICPECGSNNYSKQLSAAGFQLKGSGWYATDFKSPPAAKAKVNEPPPCQGGEGACPCPPAAASATSDSK